MINLENILFLDIETIPQYPAYDQCPEELKALWNRKAENLKRLESETPGDIYNRAGIYAEFGRIICISTGIVRVQDGVATLRIKSYSGDDEPLLLKEFASMLNKYFSRQDHKLCAHNGKEFDFPYLARRMLINRVPLPLILDVAGRKPWEVNHLDTMELWKFGDFKSYTSLTLLAYALGIPSPKNDIDGSRVWDVYWNDKDLSRIVAYCEKDVEALVNVYLRMKGYEPIPKSAIQIV